MGEGDEPTAPRHRDTPLLRAFGDAALPLRRAQLSRALARRHSQMTNDCCYCESSEQREVSHDDARADGPPRIVLQTLSPTLSCPLTGTCGLVAAMLL